MIDPASVGAAGRTVRCARCRATWFVGGQASDVTDFVDGVIKEAEAETKAPYAPLPTAAAPPPPPPSMVAAQDFPAPPSPPAANLPNWTPDAASVEPPAPEPVTISDAPSLVPPIEHAPSAESGQAELGQDDIETFAARRRRLQSMRKKSRRRSSRWTAIILVLFAFNVALVGARHEVVRYLPQTASLFSAIGLPVNLRNLNFENVRITKEIEEGATILVVQGTIVSISRKPAEVPRLRFAARNAAGQEIYVWTAKPERSILGPGETMKFSSRLASPPAEANDVMVRFFTAQDAMAGGNK
jgi:hypothetical protein